MARHSGIKVNALLVFLATAATAAAHANWDGYALPHVIAEAAASQTPLSYKEWLEYVHPHRPGPPSFIRVAKPQQQHQPKRGKSLAAADYSTAYDSAAPSYTDSSVEPYSSDTYYSSEEVYKSSEPVVCPPVEPITITATVTCTVTEPAPPPVTVTNEVTVTETVSYHVEPTSEEYYNSYSQAPPPPPAPYYNPAPVYTAPVYAAPAYTAPVYTAPVYTAPSPSSSSTSSPYSPSSTSQSPTKSPVYSATGPVYGPVPDSTTVVTVTHTNVSTSTETSIVESTEEVVVTETAYPIKKSTMAKKGKKKAVHAQLVKTFMAPNAWIKIVPTVAPAEDEVHGQMRNGVAHDGIIMPEYIEDIGYNLRPGNVRRNA
ncbi:hypothetical protein GGI04_002712 [Coemansia thaxteri]|nr:hypothetical protein GGI04_002712 [Coemansia thaxteri]